MKKKILILSCFVSAFSLFGQNTQAYIDSIIHLVKVSPDDTNKARSLVRLCWDLRVKDPVAAENYGYQALKLGQRLNFQKAIGGAYNNLGSIYELQGNEWKALQFYLKALDVKRKSNDKKGQASTLNNIGIIYKKQEDYDKAVGYYRAALKLNAESGSKAYQLKNLQNLCNVYKTQGKIDSASYFNNLALRMCKETGNEEDLVDPLMSAGNILTEYKKYREAIFYFDSSYRIMQRKELKNSTYFYFSNKGRALVNLNVLDSAQPLLQEAWEMKSKSKDWEAIGNVSESMAFLYKKKYAKTHDVKYVEEACRFLEIRYTGRDSLTNLKRRRSLSDLITQSLMNQKNEEIMAIQREKDIADLKTKNEHMFVYMLAIIVLAISSIAFAIWLRFRKNKLLSAQLAAKNKEMTDSIHYAQRIQKSLLPSEKYIARVLKKK